MAATSAAALAVIAEKPDNSVEGRTANPATSVRAHELQPALPGRQISPFELCGSHSAIAATVSSVAVAAPTKDDCPVAYGAFRHEPGIVSADQRLADPLTKARLPLRRRPEKGVGSVEWLFTKHEGTIAVKRVRRIPLLELRPHFPLYFPFEPNSRPKGRSFRLLSVSKPCLGKESPFSRRERP